jgi:ABC-type Fe3+ transport system substrate-binding protein
LARQEPVILRDTLQLVDAAGQGRYPILIGTSDNIVEERIRQGVPLAIVDPNHLREWTFTTTFNVGLFNHAAHPNAAKVYLNWGCRRRGPP